MVSKRERDISTPTVRAHIVDGEDTVTTVALSEREVFLYLVEDTVDELGDSLPVQVGSLRNLSYYVLVSLLGRTHTNNYTLSILKSNG